MNARILALTVLGIFMAGHAYATVYFDSNQATSPATASDGPSDGVMTSGDSFTASQPDFSQISLMLSASTPGDGGSVMVYLVPDNGDGGQTGHAGAQLPTSDGVKLATINDGQLGASPSLYTINFSPFSYSGLTTQNDEYWVVLQFSDGASAQWWYGADNSGAGMANQNTFDTFFPATSDSTGAYTMIVDTPEPATLAVLGGSLATLGFFRRRFVKKA